MEANREQEMINRITEEVTKSVLEAVDQKIDERFAELENNSNEEAEKAKETVNKVFKRA